MALLSQYLTVAELLNAPTGLDLKNIPAPGSTGPSGVKGIDNYAELTNIIQRASSMMDTFCRQILGATTDSEEAWTQSRKCGINKEGHLWFHTGNNPVISVSSFRYGYPAVGGTSWTSATVSDILITGERNNHLIYPAFFERFNVPKLRIQVTYVNGYPNTMMSGSAKVAAGATSLPLKDLTGIVAGQKLYVYDQGNTELVTVASNWTQTTGAGSVTLAAGTAFDHTPTQKADVVAGGQAYDIAVSALPPDIKQACIMIVKLLVEKRGSNALVMGKAGGISGSTAEHKSGDEEIPVEAQEILLAYRAVL